MKKQLQKWGLKIAATIGDKKVYVKPVMKRKLELVIYLNANTTSLLSAAKPIALLLD